MSKFNSASVAGDFAELMTPAAREERGLDLCLTLSQHG